MQEFKNIFFDLGGVLFDLHLSNALIHFAKLGLPIPPEFVEGARNFKGIPKINNPFIDMLHQMDIGVVQREQLLQIMHKQLPAGVTDQQIIDGFECMINVPASRLALLKKLRSRYNVYLLSNIGDVHWEASKRMAREAGYPVEECFDYCFCSYHLGVSKPDPRIFQKVIELSGVNPAESLYLDDAEDNITAGKAAGLIAKKIESNHLEDYIPELFPEFA